MFKFLFKISLVSLLFFGLTTSCTEDDLGGSTGNPRPVEEEPAGPTIALVADVGLVSDASTVPAGETFTVRLSAQAGEAAIKTVTVLENGSPMPLERLQYSDASVGANPTLILSDDLKTGLTWDITITAPAEEGSTAYSFEVVDENDKVDVAFLTMTVEPDVLIAPTAQVVEQPPYFWGSKTCPPGTRFTMLVVAESGSSPIQSVTVLEDGNIIEDLTRLQANGAEFPANPWTFSEGQAMLEWEVSIRTSEDGNDHNYQVVVTDSREMMSVVGIDVFAQPTGTALTNSLTGTLLLNQAGPAGTGGINLFTGESVGSSAMEATIRDEGIDLDLAAASNWRRQISGANGSVIRTVGDGQPETFSFGNVQFAEEIVNLFDTGKDLITQNAAGRDITAFIIEGDVFIVKNGDTHFLVEVTRVVQTENDNDDYYELSIKY